MNADCLKLTAYFGERDRVAGRFLADALIDIYARHELQTSLVLRGVEGFGAKKHERTDRLLSLSEDLPLAAVAVDARERIEAAHDEVAALGVAGLVTLERAGMITGTIGAVEIAEPTKLTVYLGGARSRGIAGRGGAAARARRGGRDGPARRGRHRARDAGARHVLRP